MIRNVEPGRDVTKQGHYAGAVTRGGAYVVDAATLTGLFSLATAVVFWLAGVVVGHTVDPVDRGPLVEISFLIWAFVYFWVPWATSGKTFGMALAGIRVVRGDGGVLSARRAAVRTLVLPVSILLFGIGLIGIVVGRRHRALHDVAADSAVVYAWDAKAARLRFMAKEQSVASTTGPTAR